MGEFELIDKIKSSFSVPDGMTGIGDDCAVIPQKDGKDTLVSTDMLVEDIHFLADDISPADLGWKSAAVNISDIAAMGGRPVSTYLSIALPRSIGQEWVMRFIEGYRSISEMFGVTLLGGDTCSSPDKLCISVTVLGECAHGGAILRSGAKPGDSICVTGTLGDSAAGLKAILEGRRRDDLVARLIDAHYHPVPEVEAGLSLASTGIVSSMIDISDGVASDIRHIMEESGVGAKIHTERIPLSEELQKVCSLFGWDPISLALEGGEDYHLLFTCPSGSELPVKHTVIGEITDTGRLEWSDSGRNYQGFRHF